MPAPLGPVSPVSAPPERPQVPTPPECPQVPAPPECPQVPALPEHPPEPAPPERPPAFIDFPIFIFFRGGGGGHIDSPDPPWPLESPDPSLPLKLPALPWRPPVSPFLTSLQGANPPSPLNMLQLGTHLLRERGGTLCSLFFPYCSCVSLFGYVPFLVELIWLLLAPVLVILDYILCVYKSWVPPESLSVHSSFIYGLPVLNSLIY